MRETLATSLDLEGDDGEAITLEGRELRIGVAKA
jgi:hypothetical protein